RREGGRGVLQSEVRVVPFADRRSARLRVADHRRAAAAADVAHARQRHRPRRSPARHAEAGDGHRHAGIGGNGRGPAGSHRRLRRLADHRRRDTPIVPHSGRYAESRRARSVAAAQGSAARLHGRGHSQRDRLSGDTEMRRRATTAVKGCATGAIVTRFALALAGMCVAAVVIVTAADGLDPATLLKPLADQWPSYSGDYTGRRYSALTQINQSNVKNMTLAWTSRLSSATNARTQIGGEGTGEVTVAGAVQIKGAVLMFNNVLYVTAPDHVWALDAHDGHEIWHYFWKTRGGTHIGNRGAAMWGNYLFFVTPDDYFVSIDARTGKERWHKEMASFA